MAGGEALEQLIALLHNTLAACDSLPVHTYASAGDGAHSLKTLSEPIQIGLHLDGVHSHSQHDAEGGGDSGGGAPALPPVLHLSIDPLVRAGQLEQHLLRTSAVRMPSACACARASACHVHAMCTCMPAGAAPAAHVGGA